MSDDCNCGENCNDGCDCGHDHDHEEMEYLTLNLDGDKDVECAILGTFDLDGKEYMALLPEDSDEVIVFSFVVSDDEELVLDPIEDEDEFNKVAAEFKNLYGEDNFEFE